MLAVACAIFCTDHFLKTWVSAKSNYLRILIKRENLLVNWTPGACLSIEFEIQWNFVMLLFITYSSDHNKILHKSQQCNCHDSCKISLWLVEHVLNQSTSNSDRISNSIEIRSMGWAPGPQQSQLFQYGKTLSWLCYLYTSWHQMAEALWWMITIKSLILDAPNPKTLMFLVSSCPCLDLLKPCVK